MFCVFSVAVHGKKVLALASKNAVTMSQLAAIHLRCIRCTELSDLNTGLVDSFFNGHD